MVIFKYVKKYFWDAFHNIIFSRMRKYAELIYLLPDSIFTFTINLLSKMFAWKTNLKQNIGKLLWKNNLFMQICLSKSIIPPKKNKIEQASDCYLSLLLFEYNFHIADNSSVAWEKKNAALITGIVFGVSLVIIVTIGNFCLWRRYKRWIYSIFI